MPPQSGSIKQNGKVLAEQIGGQIFSDVWGLVSPYDYQEAARLAEIAARVSHDGVAVDGGRFVAALISAAFYGESIKEIITHALSVIPESSLYANMVRDIVRFYENDGSVEACFEYIKKNYWKDKYGGNCHIIPNAAIMIYSLLYGEGDFCRTLKIANYSGFDTDCNAGNLGTVMGVMTDLKGVDYDKWIAPLRDTTICSSVLGYENIVSIPSFTYDVFRNALRLKGERYHGKYEKAVYRDKNCKEFDFLLPKSVNGMRAENAKMENTGGEIKITSQTPECIAFIKTYYGKDDLYDNRYDPAFSPLVYPGQTLRADYRTEEAVVRIFCEDIHTGQRYYSPSGVKVWRMDVPKDSCIGKIGLAIQAKPGCSVTVSLLAIEGLVDYAVDFEKEKMEEYSLEHREVSQCTYYKGVWDLEDGYLTGRCLEDGQLYTSKPLGNFEMKTFMTPVIGDTMGILFGVRGAGKQRRLIFQKGEVMLIEYQFGEEVLAREPYLLETGKQVEIWMRNANGCLQVRINGKMIFDFPLEIRNGCVGVYVGGGSVVKLKRVDLKETL